MSKLVISPAEIWRDWYPDRTNDDHWEGAPLSTGGRITSPFGVFRPRYGTYHSGIDLAAPLGSSIVAPEAGEVVYVNGGRGGFYRDHALGVFLILQHVNGWETLYAHMQPGSIVHLAGERIERGETLGKIGVTGNTTGPHVHFMVADAPRSMQSGNPHLRNAEAYIRKIVPLLEGSESPTDEPARVDLGVRAFIGLNNIKIEGQPVEYRRGYEWSVYRVSLLLGRVTDDD